MSNVKVKGLLKGLRYISQIFDNEKEQEMQIGYPTDVKHVAHIGLDGPSITQPSWMSEFKALPRLSSSSLNGDAEEKDDASVRSVVSEGSSRRGKSAQALSPSAGSPARDLLELPKPTRRRSSTGATGESPVRDKSDKPKQRRSTRTNNELSDGVTVKPSSRHSKDSIQGCESSPSNLPDVPKKSSRRKKSKDGGGGSGSSRSRARAQALEGDDGTESVSSISNKSSNKEKCHTSSELYAFEESAEKGLTQVS